ncbi:MAG TPA: DUF4394 domain-containing protein [Chthoniobacterales bacterium]
MKRLLVLAFLTVSMAFAIPQAQAATCFAVNESNMLYKINTASPTAAAATAITGLPAGFRIVGLDFRTTARAGSTTPGIGTLWALGTDGSQAKLFQINPTTAAATLIGNLSLSASILAGSDNGWFFGFDPATDTLRILNFFYNFQVDPNTLASTAQTQLTGFPALNGSAYLTAPIGGTTQIFFLEQNNDGLNTSTNISTGTYSALPTPMNAAFSQPAGLDYGEGTMLAAFFNTSGGANKAQLFTVSTSGTFSLIGDISGTPGTLSIRALAIQPTSFPTPVSVTVKVSGKKKITTTARSLKIKGNATSKAGVNLVQYKIGKGKLKKAKGTTKWSFKAKLKPGTNKITVIATGGNGVQSKPAKIKVTVDEAP